MFREKFNRLSGVLPPIFFIVLLKKANAGQYSTGQKIF